MDWQHQVRLFMTEIKGLELPRQPVVQQAPLIRELCKALCKEELEELTSALDADDLVGIADGMADLIYVVLYTANAYGILLEPIFKEVQRSNMTKAGAGKAANGKQLKGANYSPPDIVSLIQAQIKETPDHG